MYTAVAAATFEGLSGSAFDRHTKGRHVTYACRRGRKGLVIQGRVRKRRTFWNRSESLIGSII